MRRRTRGPYRLTRSPDIVSERARARKRRIRALTLIAGGLGGEDGRCTIFLVRSKIVALLLANFASGFRILRTEPVPRRSESRWTASRRGSPAVTDRVYTSSRYRGSSERCEALGSFPDAIPRLFFSFFFAVKNSVNKILASRCGSE